MHTFDTSVESYGDVWKRDKELLRKSVPNIGINWENTHPTNQDAYCILDTMGKAWESSCELSELDNFSLEKILEWLVTDLENLWKTKFEERPEIEILPTSKYMPRINELEAEINEQFGYGAVSRSPPTIYHFPSHGKILVPQRFLARKPKGRFTYDVTSADFDVEELTWNKPFLESVLARNLSTVLFRQLRCEWKSDYVRAMRAVGPYNEQTIRMLGGTIAQYINEVIASGNRPQWSLYVVGDKIGIWQSHEQMDNYRAIQALSAVRDVSQIAMIDAMNVDGNKVIVDMSRKHPYYSRKAERFLNVAH